MKFNPSFSLRDICGEKVLIANGIENIDFGALIHLNSTAADIYQHFLGKEFSIEQTIEYVTTEYDVAREVAAEDIKKLMDMLREARVLTD